MGCNESFPAMTAKVLATEDDSSQQPHPWRRRFLERMHRQCIWDARKLEHQQLRQRRAEQQQQLLEDKQRGHNFRGQASQSDTKTQRTLRSVRTRDCRRCGITFLPLSNPADACRWHWGKYVRVDGGDEDPAVDAIITEQRVQQAIRANNRKKKSRQASSMMPVQLILKSDIVRDASAVTRLGQLSQARSWAWSCCGAGNVVAP